MEQLQVFVDPAKTTSGQRFFVSLAEAVRAQEQSSSAKAGVILFNISAPIWPILAAKLRGQKVVLRVDGLYSDDLSEEFAQHLPVIFRLFARIGLRYRKWREGVTLFANLLNQNYRHFLRILLADHVVYQSEFSKYMHRRYFKRKPNSVVLNGASYRPSAYVSPRKNRAEWDLELVTIFDGQKPAKRVADLVAFVEWMNEATTTRARLTIIGYSSTETTAVPRRVHDRIQSGACFVTYPRFDDFEGFAGAALQNADAYITFSFRDPCPNAVIESMAFGLPVIGCASGGVPEIVRDAGCLVQVDDFATGYFAAHRFEHSFPELDFDKLYRCVICLIENHAQFRERVAKRFEEDLSIDIAAQKYIEALRSLK